nr:hypothetical protein [Tanacetum cinerariifolium]
MRYPRLVGLSRYYKLQLLGRAFQFLFCLALNMHIPANRSSTSMIQQYLQNEHYALWEVIEFRDSYEAPQDDAATGSVSEGSGKKKGMTVTVTTEDMQKRRNDVKARTTLLLAPPDEHQLRFSKYKTAQELWAAILKTFGGN